MRDLLVVLGLICILAACKSNAILTHETINNDSTFTILTFEGEEYEKELVIEEIYNSDSVKISEIHFKDGKYEGTWKQWHPNGKLKYEGAFKDGLKHGYFKYYDSNGAVCFEGEMQHGKKEGTWITWYDHASIEEERQYKNDRLNGKWTYYYIDGHLMKEEYYVEGQKVREENYE